MEIRDKKDRIIEDGVPFMYKAICDKEQIKAKTYTENGIRYIEWEDGIKHELSEFWFDGLDEELSEII